MNSEPGPNRSPGKEGPPEDAARAHGSVFLYKDSGIREKHGHIPSWLLVVVVALIVWGVYYLVAFWSPPPN